MSQSLCFNEFTFSPLIRDNQPWFKSSELARALGYSSEKSIANIYQRNSEEFSNDMSVVINLSTTDIPIMTRIFSLRGCHLLAMFARTPVAKSFRRWVLDVIEQYGDKVPVSEPVTINDLPSSELTPALRAELKLIVDAKLSTYPADVQGKARAEIWTKFNRHFRIAEYKQLPEAKMPDAREFLLTLRVRAINAIPTAEAAIPTPPSFDETPFLRLAEDIRVFQQNYRRTYGLLFARLYQLGAPLFVQLEQRATQRRELEHFSDMTIHGQFDRFISERLQEGMSSFSEQLRDKDNAAMLLLACARAMNARV